MNDAAANTSNSTDDDILRWRLVLGRFSERSLGACGPGGSNKSRMDRVLDYLYGREYQGRSRDSMT